MLIFLVFGLLTAYLAHRKGYNPVLWFFAAGLIGLICILILPDVSKSDMSDEERAGQIKRGNIIGGVIVALSLVLSLVFVSVRRPIIAKKSEELKNEADKSACEYLVCKIHSALEQYQLRSPKSTENNRWPDSLHDPDFINGFLDGELPENPFGRDWDIYYYPEKDSPFGGICPGPIDVERACAP